MMKQGFFIVLFTAIVFAGGYGVRLWTEGVQPIPAVPVVPVAGSPTAAAVQNQRAQIVSNIQRWTADSGVFSKGVAALDSEFETAFKAILTPRNLQARTEWQQSFQSRFGRNGNGNGNGNGRGPNQGPDRGGQATRGGDGKPVEVKPMTDEEFERLRRAPLGLVARMLAVDEGADIRRQQYALDEKQLAQTKELFAIRRDKFIALTSGISAMSIQYSALAQEIDRLTAGLDADGKAGAKADAPKKVESGKSEPGK